MADRCASRPPADPPIVAVLGPTGAGKSALAQRLAAQTGAHLINCDSVQVYRGLDIGSAKPSAAERAAVVHHGLDLADPCQDDFDAARYVAHADAAYAQARAAGKPVVLCGGTGLYFRAFRYGLAPDLPSSADVRSTLLAAEARAPGVSYQRLLEIDPVSAERIHPNHRQAVLRALEICTLTGRPASALRAAHGFRTARYAFFIIYLQPPAAVLKARLAQRLAAMLAAGFKDEVAALLAAGVSPQARPLQALGYKQIVAHLQGNLPAADLQLEILRQSWQYARRQRTWFRAEGHCLLLTTGDDPQGLAAARRALGFAEVLHEVT